MELYNHQINKSKELYNVLKTKSCAYLRGEVRSGKTLTVLETARLYGVKKVLFITKKKAISSIESDYNLFNFKYNIEVINYESVHKATIKPDLVIYDEAHVLSGFPKPSKRVKTIKSLFYNIPCIWLSGTPSAESYSQWYHQLFVNVNSPFKKYTNFYKWSKDFVSVTEKRIGTHSVRDYTNANVSAIDHILSPYSVIMTQEQAGFKTSIKEHILEVAPPVGLHKLVRKLLRDKAIEGKKGYIMGDLPAKLKSKVHQIYNGTCILEDVNGNTIPHIFSDYKAQFIKYCFKDKKIAIMYYYKLELEVLKNVFKTNITDDLEEFNTSNKNLAVQQSSTEGMNISKADCLVYYNFGFSGKNYIQSRDRLTVKSRLKNDVYFIIENNGINGDILDRVRDKKDFNISAFYETARKIKK